MAKKKKENNTEAADLKNLLGGQQILSAREFISTGSTLLDYALANKKDGGVPAGRITEICGNEATGKSLLAYHIMANTQKKGGIAIYLDIERAADETFMKRMGVDVDKLIYPKPPKSIEGVFDYIENTIKVTRAKFPDKERLVTIVWDSVAATTSKEQIEVEYGEGRIGPEARAMSNCFRKAIDMLELGYVTLVCVNQLRTKIGVMFGDPEITPHGKALPFYASARIKMKSMGKLKEGNKKFGRIIGVGSKAEVFKNKCAPAHRKAEFPIYFDWGIDDEASWLDYLKDLGVITTSGAWSTLKVNGEHKFQGTEKFKEIIRDAEIRKSILQIIDDDLVIKFDKKPEGVIVEDATTVEANPIIELGFENAG